VATAAFLRYCWGAVTSLNIYCLVLNENPGPQLRKYKFRRDGAVLPAHIWDISHLGVKCITSGITVAASPRLQNGMCAER